MKETILNLVLLRMAQGYEEQLPQYEKMYSLALEQEKCLQGEEVDTDRLLDLINQRQELIDTLEKLNQGIVPLKEEVRKALGVDEFTIRNVKKHFDGAGLQDLDRILEKISGILERIKRLDQNNEELLRHWLGNTADRLADLQKAKKAHQAYQGENLSQEGFFVDFSK